MSRLAAFLASLVLVPAAARAQPAAVVGEVRVADGAGDDDAMRLGVAGGGVRWRVAPTLDVQALVLGLATAGTSELGEPAAGGFGGEVGARITPWPDGTVRPYASASLGLLLFLDEPFLPGGDVYEGIISFGAGAEVTLPGCWRASAHAFSVHLSNGQGIGPFNPAYDGAGVTLAAACARSAPAPAAAPPRPPTPRRDLVVDATLGAVDEARYTSGRLRPSVRLAPWLTGALDLEAGALAGTGFVEAGIDVVAEHAPWRAGLHGGYRHYAGIDVAVATAQAELRVTPELDLLAMFHHERSDLFDPLTRAAVGLRLAPTATLTLDLGVGFDRLGDDTVFEDDHSDPYLGVEWRSPLRHASRHVTLFLERQVSTADLLGVRLTTAAPAWRRVR